MMSNDTKTVSQAEFGRMTGHSRQRVGQMVKAGQLTAINGRIHVPLGLAELEKLRPRARPQAAPPAAATPEADEAPTYAVSRARREAAAAEREHLALAREARQLLEAADVYSTAADAAALFRAAMEDMPARLAPQLASCGSDEARIVALLNQHVEQALRSLSARLEAIGGEPPP